jgi:hypothetical protein
MISVIFLHILCVCVCATSCEQMSVWKSNFFLQTGLPESIPKPPKRPRAEDEQFATENNLPVARRVGQRGKDKFARKKRTQSLFNFYECMRAIEHRETNGNIPITAQETQHEYHAMSKQQRAYWEYMHELYFIFEKQQKIADFGTIGTESAHSRKQKLWNKFYYLNETDQQQLVRDYLADRWERENYQYVQETCHQDNLRHLVDIRKDLKLLLGKVEKALAPPKEE